MTRSERAGTDRRDGRCPGLSIGFDPVEPGDGLIGPMDGRPGLRPGPE